MTQTPEISVVVPLFNEVENVLDLYRELKGALDPLGRTYEVAYVATDASGNQATAVALVTVPHDELQVALIEQ